MHGRAVRACPTAFRHRPDRDVTAPTPIAVRHRKKGPVAGATSSYIGTTAGCIFLDQPPRIVPRGPTWGAIGSRRAFFRNAIVDCRLNHCETRCKEYFTMDHSNHAALSASRPPHSSPKPGIAASFWPAALWTSRSLRWDQKVDEQGKFRTRNRVCVGQQGISLVSPSTTHRRILDAWHPTPLARLLDLYARCWGMGDRQAQE